MIKIKPVFFLNKYVKILLLKDVTYLRELDKTKAMIKFKSMLMATVTHELRTPVNSIVGMLALLFQLMGKQENNKAIDFIQIAQNSCDLLLNLIHDILVLYIYIYILVLYIYIYILYIYIYIGLFKN